MEEVKPASPQLPSPLPPPLFTLPSPSLPPFPNGLILEWGEWTGRFMYMYETGLPCSFFYLSNLPVSLFSPVFLPFAPPYFLLLLVPFTYLSILLSFLTLHLYCYYFFLTFSFLLFFPPVFLPLTPPYLPPVTSTCPSLLLFFLLLFLCWLLFFPYLSIPSVLFTCLPTFHPNYLFLIAPSTCLPVLSSPFHVSVIILSFLYLSNLLVLPSVCSSVSLSNSLFTCPVYLYPYLSPPVFLHPTFLPSPLSLFFPVPSTFSSPLPPFYSSPSASFIPVSPPSSCLLPYHLPSPPSSPPLTFLHVFSTSSSSSFLPSPALSLLAS